MENIGLEELEHTSYGGTKHAEIQTCILEEDDTQCGHVFFNENSRLLKFYCTFCRETFDNIEYYCLHLSEHISDETEEINENLEAEDLIKQDSLDLLHENENSNEDLQKIEHEDGEKEKFTHDPPEDEQLLEDEMLNHKYNGTLTEFDNSEMFIEEIQDADDIREVIAQENNTMAEDTIFMPLTTVLSNNRADKDNCILKPITPSADGIRASNSFEECFIKETNIDKIRNEGVCVLKDKKGNNCTKPMQRRSNLQDLLRLKRRRRKVTTVKVIAVKNRIAELYERIKRKQEKSQQILSNEFLNLQQQEQETQDAIESLINHNVEHITEDSMTSSKGNDSSSDISSNITRKIVGETLITLIPEGTKIPNKLPSPLKTNLKNDMTNANESSPQNLNSIASNTAFGTNEKKAVCPACGKTFRSHFSLTIHKRIHYLESDSSVKLAHKCPDCDQLFNKLSQLKVHVESVHYPEGFICKICNRQLSSMSLLERHMVKVHLGRPFNCKSCNKNFSDPVTYEKHLASHNSEQVFKCTTCGRKYSTEFFLLEHMRNHKEQIPQTCVVCGKVTLRITQHMKTHTPRPKRLLSCSVCGKVFNFSSGLSHHFKIMHKQPRPQLKPKSETNVQRIKRKRPSRNVNATSHKKKTLRVENDKFSDQIIEEQIQVPVEVYEGTTSAILNLQGKENLINLQKPSQKYSNLPQLHISKRDSEQNNYGQQQDDIINHKEEEAKRVIVELIQNSTYTSFFPDNFSSVLEATPPIAREETISAVNSIVNDC